MKTLIENAEKNTQHQFGYQVRCDDKNAPSQIIHDKYFHLWEFESLSAYIDICEKHKLNYDLVIQDFDSTANTWDEINVINRNYLNQ